MFPNINDLIEELRLYDEESIEERAERYGFLKELESDFENTLFHGEIAKLAFEAAGNAFIQAKFISSIVMAQIVIDQTLNQMFLASGEYMGNNNFPTLIRNAKEKGWISSKESNSFNYLKDIRNPYVHYKKPLEKNTLLNRSIENGKCKYHLLEEDAKTALTAMYKIVNKFVF